MAVDAELDDLDLLNQEAVEGLELLEPYGSGNPKPVFTPGVALRQTGGHNSNDPLVPVLPRQHQYGALRLGNGLQRPGLRALLHEAGMDEKPLSSISIGYTLSPRINASGRMGCAPLAAEPAPPRASTSFKATPTPARDLKG